MFLARGLQGEGFPLLLLSHGALPHTPQGVTDSLTSICGQAMRKFRMVWPQGQLSCPARGEAAGGAAGPMVGRYHGRMPVVSAVIQVQGMDPLAGILRARSP
jgi:hypothetical protein